MKKGFTLLELLIVISILAILMVIVAVVLNPGELIAQARDAQRISDLSSLRSVLPLYMASISPNSLGACNRRCTLSGVTPFGTDISPVGCATISTSTLINSAGWVDVNFNDISGGSPFSKLPIDPVNKNGYYYGYACDDSAKTFELVAVLESEKYTIKEDFDGKDGGNRANIYEIGTDPGLDL
ncbi:type II secretion system protein [Candidatus Wolfebacteria bacterium]|nr:type II secretion system protein [Candidatus Wolfebacteria bacterium]